MELASNEIAMFSRTLATTFTIGTPLLDALDGLMDSTDGLLRNAIVKIRQDMSQGIQLNHSMQKTGVFPDPVIGQVAEGEAIGTLDKVFSEIATAYES